MIASNLRRSLFAMLAVLYITPAWPQGAVLPGGATSLRETHGDWVVNCAVVGEADQASKVCTLSQEQQDSKSGQRIIAVELRPSAKANAATLVLPFGLDLAAGAALQIDDGAVGEPLPFRTCLAGGCLVSANIDPKMLASLRDGTALKAHVKADGGKEMMFSISLKGFGGAFDRTVDLAK